MNVGGALNSGEAERQLLEGELHEAECMLLGEVQQTESLAQENNKKVEELRGLKDDVKLLQERNEYHASMLQDEHASSRQELVHELAVLREKVAQLDLKHERYKEVARLNEVAGAEVESLLLKMERRTRAHGEDVHATRQEMLHLRQQLESTFRKTLKDLGGTYRRKAFEALGGEAKAGMRANKMLREETALQKRGVTALCERHGQQVRKTWELMRELKKLSRCKLGHESALAGLQREAIANATSLCDVQETKRRINAEMRSLKMELEKEGVPSLKLNEVRDMARKEREEARRLRKLTLRWQRRAGKVLCAILPSCNESPQKAATLGPAAASGSENSLGAGGSSSASGNWSSSTFDSSLTASSTSAEMDASLCRPRKLRGSRSAPPGLEMFCVHEDNISIGRHLAAGSLCKRQVAEAAWRARVARVTRRWSGDDGNECGSHRRIDFGARDRDQQRTDAWPDILQAQLARHTGKRSASLTALESGVSPSAIKSRARITKPVPGPIPGDRGKTGATPPARLGASASMGSTTFLSIVEENPWEKKRRMERAVRRRDAGIRARGLAVNSSRTKPPMDGGPRGSGRGEVNPGVY